MLDWPHQLVLEAVSRGDDDDSPALHALVATGLVERRADGSHAVTQAGRAALEAGKPSRLERLLWRALAVCGGIFAVGTIVRWVT